MSTHEPTPCDACGKYACEVDEVLCPRCKERAKARRKPLPAYAALLAKSNEIGLPEFHTADLTEWDRDEIARRIDAEPAFLWAVWQSGTYLVWPHQRNPAVVRRFGRQPAIDYVRCIDESFEQVRWFWWSDGRLTELETSEAAERLEREERCERESA